MEEFIKEAPCKKSRVSEQPIIGFFEEDKVGTIQSHEDALVVTLQIAGFDVKRVMIDEGSGLEIMYPDLFEGLGIRLEDLDHYDAPLIEFDGDTTIPKGMIWLPVQMGDKVVAVSFIVVGAFSPYTTILAKPWLHAMGAVSYTLHVKVKYPTRARVVELDKKQLVDFLKDNLDVFAWSAYEAPGVDPEFICHRLKKQSPQRSSKEHAKVVKDEVRKLKQVGAIKEVFYPKWLANTMVVKKK
ncbi:uncharacterized protein LOC142612398 [Castanea sativa]|uniref:uncharacterized protein LOC142612398 n=1 Tax=Castanea sativa TaxID=21020 RepID=UPI003F64D12C